MSVYIEESEVEFGPFLESNLFRIETSAVRKSLGEGIKSVEFIYMPQNMNKLIFLEAKKTCPRPQDTIDTEHKESIRKKENREKYYQEVVQKFIDSFHLMLAISCKRGYSEEGIGSVIKENMNIKTQKFYYLVVITHPDADESWLAAPKAELERRLLPFRKIWKLEVVVLNRAMAQEIGICKR